MAEQRIPGGKGSARQGQRDGVKKTQFSRYGMNKSEKVKKQSLFGTNALLSNMYNNVITFLIISM